MSETRSALVIDDERDIRELLVMTLGRMGLRCDTASSVADARNQLARNRYDLCLTDMRLPDGSGIDLIAEITQKFPNTPVAMITAFGNVEDAVEALKAGAFDFVSKPVELTVLRDLVRHALELNEPHAPAADAVELGQRARRSCADLRIGRAITQATLRMLAGEVPPGATETVNPVAALTMLFVECTGLLQRHGVGCGLNGTAEQ